MKGNIISLDKKGNSGVIRGQDNIHYNFTYSETDEIKGYVPNTKVEFDIKTEDNKINSKSIKMEKTFLCDEIQIHKNKFIISDTDTVKEGKIISLGEKITYETTTGQKDAIKELVDYTYNKGCNALINVKFESRIGLESSKKGFDTNKYKIYQITATPALVSTKRASDTIQESEYLNQIISVKKAEFSKLVFKNTIVIEEKNPGANKKYSIIVASAILIISLIISLNV